VDPVQELTEKPILCKEQPIVPKVGSYMNGHSFTPGLKPRVPLLLLVPKVLDLRCTIVVGRVDISPRLL
jgi:hypothetical protein